MECYSKEFLDVCEENKYAVGVYVFYDEQKNVVHVGKSKTLGSTLKRAKKYGVCFVRYALTESDVDAQIYMLLYRSRHGLDESSTFDEFDELQFSDFIPVYIDSKEMKKPLGKLPEVMPIPHVAEYIDIPATVVRRYIPSNPDFIATKQIGKRHYVYASSIPNIQRIRDRS